jgi:tRNA-Thr(GGU) m(6)t(6)A37 methyltransferase TsaA
MSDNPDYQIPLTPIGTIRSCYREKFGIPRQPGLVTSASAVLELSPPYDAPDALRGLEEFSHLWIIYLFHASARDQWKATVRPPRLGGNRRIGVFASRSNFRPNPVGLSAARLLGIEGSTLKLGGGDFLDGTPVLDIKPYLPYADSLPDAGGSYAGTAPERIYTVTFAPGLDETVRLLEENGRPALEKLIREMLAYDPRPAYRTDERARRFGTRLFDLDVRWTLDGDRIKVLSVDPIPDGG